MNPTINTRERLFLLAPNQQRHYSPLANIKEHPNEYLITIALPGFQRNQLAVVVDKDILSISPVNKEKSRQSKGSLHEYDYSHWHRKFVLPHNADTTMMASNYINGELIIHIPKHAKTVLHEDVLNVVVY